MTPSLTNHISSYPYSSLFSIYMNRLENIKVTHSRTNCAISWSYDWCPSLSCPLDSLPPGGQPNRGWLAPRGASCPGISCPPPPTLVIFTPGGQAVQAGLSCPAPTQVKIYICYFVIFLYHFNKFRSSISHKVRNWCLWG